MASNIAKWHAFLARTRMLNIRRKLIHMALRQDGEFLRCRVIAVVVFASCNVVTAVLEGPQFSVLASVSGEARTQALLRVRAATGCGLVSASATGTLRWSSTTPFTFFIVRKYMYDQVTTQVLMNYFPKACGCPADVAAITFADKKGIKHYSSVQPARHPYLRCWTCSWM